MLIGHYTPPIMTDGRVNVRTAAISTQIQDNAATNGSSTATIELTVIFEALESCKKNGKAQNIENVSEICMKDVDGARPT